jgi:hypothetical protein
MRLRFKIFVQSIVVPTSGEVMLKFSIRDTTILVIFDHRLSPLA